MDRLYRYSVDLLSSATPVPLPWIIPICHREMLSAAIAIARGLPHEAGAPTRRVAEAARLAVAIAHDKANLHTWLASEQRMGRWDARNEQRKPEALRVQLKLPHAHHVLDTLGSLQGILSDAFVHFTPELLSVSQLEFLEDGRGAVPWFMIEGTYLRNQLVLLATVHHLALLAFDELSGKAFMRMDPWWKDLEELHRHTLAYAKRLGFGKLE